MIPAFSPIAQDLAARALNTAAEGALLAITVWVLLRIFARNQSRTRFTIWFLALLILAVLPFAAGAHVGLSHASLPHANFVLPASFAEYLFIAWLVGASVSLLKLGAGLWRVWQLRESCAELDVTSLDPRIVQRLEEHGRRQRIRICTSDEVSVPTAIGFLRPAVVLPASLLSQLSAEELEVIVLHELAHLQRWDDWTNLAQKLVKAVFFFHPAVWWIERRLSLEREMACDEMVVAATGSAKGYAFLLIAFTEKLQGQRSLVMVHGLVNRVCQLSLRIKEILATTGARRTRLRKSLLTVSAGLFAVAVGLTAHAPRLIGFAPPQTQEAQVVRHPLLQKVSDEGRPAQMIPAVFHPDAAVRPVPSAFSAKPARAKTPARKAMIRRTAKAAGPHPFPAQRVFVVLQQAEYEQSGAAVWSICVWQLEAGEDGAAQLESAIVMKI